MNTQVNIQQKIAELRLKQQAAQDAEQARLAAEKANRETIAQAEQEIQSLQLQAIEAQFFGVFRAKEIVEHLPAVIKAIRAELEEVKVGRHRGEHQQRGNRSSQALDGHAAGFEIQHQARDDGDPRGHPPNQ